MSQVYPVMPRVSRRVPKRSVDFRALEGCYFAMGGEGRPEVLLQSSATEERDLAVKFQDLFQLRIRLVLSRQPKSCCSNIVKVD